MGFDVKAIIITICKFCFRSMCKYVKKYPLISGLMCLVFLIYLFNPPIFVFLIYASPLIVVTMLLYRFYIKPRKSKNAIKKEKKVEKFSISSTMGKSKSVESDRPVATKPTRSMSQRRNKERFFVEADPTTAQEIKASISDFLMSATPTTNLDLLDKVSFIEERDRNDESAIMKDNKEVQSSLTESKDSLLDGETSNHGLARNYIANDVSDFSLKSHSGRYRVNGVGGEEFGSSEEDEEVHGQRNKAVEWNEDDQKNLMDLGISEIERNRRLESLIARRRARKLFKMNTEKGMMDIDVGPCSPPSAITTAIVAPVLISRNDAFHVNHVSKDDHFPGSAPSILLPGKNPFDLPYDPHEEKLDLMADSFQQEFSITPHKEMFMCRHESFSLGPFFPLTGMHDGQMGHPRPNMPFGNIDEQKPPRHNDPIARTVSVTDLVTDHLGIKEPEQSPSKLSSESIEEKEAKVSKITSDNFEIVKEKNSKEDTNKNENPIEGSEISPNPRPPALPRPIPKAASASDLSNGASLSIIHNTRVDDHYQGKGSWHTPTNSVASDLQVEVSEVGSPPSTMDGTDTDDDKSLTYDGDIEKEINYGSDELWGLSPHAPRIGKHELAMRFLDEASEEGMRKTGLSTNVKESISAATPLETLEITPTSQVTTTDFDGEIISDIEQVKKEVGSKHLTKDNIGLSATKNDDIVHLRDSKGTLDSLHGATNVDTMKNHDPHGADVKDKVEEMKSIEKQTIYEIKHDQLRPTEKISSGPDSHIEREQLQGPEKVANVIVKRSEQADSSSSTNNLIGRIEKLHHEEDGEKLAKLDPSINNHDFISTQVDETSSSFENIEDLRANIKSVNIQQILTPSESQWKNSFKDEKDSDLFEVGAKRIDSSTSPETALSIQPKDRMEEYIIDSSFNTSPHKNNVSPTQINETFGSTEEVKNVTSGNIEQILESCETQLTNSIEDGKEQSDTFEVGATKMNLSSMSTTSLPMQPEVAMDGEVINSSSLLSPVSVLADMSQASQLSPPHVEEQIQDMDNLVFQLDQNPPSHNSLDEQLIESSIAFPTTEKPHRSTSTDKAHSDNLEMGSTNSLVKTTDQRQDITNLQRQQWNYGYKGEMKPITSIESICTGDLGATIGTHPMQEFSKSLGDDKYNLSSSADVELAIVDISKSESNRSHTTPEEKVDKRISSDLLEKNKNFHPLIDEKNERDSLISNTQEDILELSKLDNGVPYIGDKTKSMSTLKKDFIMDPPSIANLISSTFIASESLSSIKKDASEEPLRQASLEMPTDIHDDIIESIGDTASAKPLRPGNSISSNIFEGGEPLSSTHKEHINAPLKESNFIFSEGLKTSYESISKAMVEEPLNSTDFASLETMKGGSISSLREEAITEPLKQTDLNSPNVIEGRTIQKIIQETIAEPLELAESISSMPLERESISSTQQKAIGQPFKVVDFSSSKVVDSKSKSSMEEAIIGKSLELDDQYSEKPLEQEAMVEPPKLMESRAFESESLSSMMQGAIEESPQPAYLISSNVDEGKPLSSSKEETIFEQQKPTSSSSSNTLGSDSLSSIQQEVSVKPHNFIPIEVQDKKVLLPIKEEAIVQQQKLAGSISSMDEIHGTNLQREVVHVDFFKPIGEIESSGINKNVSHEQNLAVKTGIEYNIDESLYSLLQSPVHQIGIDHHHLQNSKSSLTYDMNNNQCSEANYKRDAHVSQTTNRQDDLPMMSKLTDLISAHPTGKDDVQLNRVTQNKENVLLVPSQPQAGESGPT